MNHTKMQDSPRSIYITGWL